MILNLYISYHYTRQQLNARSIRKIIIKAQRFRSSALIFTSSQRSKNVSCSKPLDNIQHP